MPSEFMQPGNIRQFARRSVRHIPIPDDFALIAHDLLHQLRQLLNRDFLARTNVHMTFAAIMLQQEDAGIRHIIHI